MGVSAELSVLSLFHSVSLIVKAIVSHPRYTSELGPSPTPSRDLCFPRLQGSFYSVIYQQLGLSPQGERYFSPNQLLGHGARSKPELP